jgi:hypothetical protein
VSWARILWCLLCWLWGPVPSSLSHCFQWHSDWLCVGQF